MKNLNYLSKIRGYFSASQSNVVVFDRRLTVVRPSFDRRSSLLKLVSVLVLILTIGSGNAWGTDYSFVSSIPSGWTASPDPNSYETSNLTRGATWQANFSLTFAGVSNVTQIVITYSTNNNQTGFSVTVGGNSWGGATQSLASGDRHATKTFSGSAASGDIVISCARTAKSIYVEQISITTGAAQTYTVTYNLNGGSGTTPTETNKTSGATFALHNGTTGITAPSGKAFSKWRDQDSNDFNGGATYTMPAKNVTLTAQWADLYTITYNAGSGSCNTPSWSQTAGNLSTTLPTATISCDGWSFAGWCTLSAGSSASNTSSPGTILTGSYTPTGNVILYAVYTKSEGGGGGTTYTRVSASEVTAGTYVIAALKSTSASTTYYAATGNVSSGDMTVESTGVTSSTGTFTTLPAGGAEFTFTGDNSTGFSINNGSGNLYFTASSNRNLAFQANNNTKWKVYAHETPLNSDGVYLQYYDGSSSYYTITENSTGDGAIRGYASNTKYRAIYLFKKSSGGGTTYYMTNYACSAPACSVCTYYVWDGSDWVDIGTTAFDEVVLTPPNLPNNNHAAGNGCWTTDKTKFDGGGCTTYASGSDYRYVPNPGGAAPTSVNKPGDGVCELYAVYTDGNSCFSTKITAYECARIWDEPDNLTVSAIGTTTATLTWDAIAGVSSYHVTVTPAAGGAAVFDGNVNTNSKSFTTGQLTAGTEYEWSVYANHATYAACNSNPTDGDNFTTCAAGWTSLTPTVTADGTGKTTGEALFELTGAVSYTVTLKNNSTSAVISGYDGISNTTGDIEFTGLTASTTYRVEVVAVNACGENSAMASETFTTTALTLYTVTFHNAAGSAPSAVTQVDENGTVSIPSTSACEGWTFAGWKIGGSQSSTTSDPTGSGTWITSNSWPKSYTPSGNIDAYAVFKQTSGGGSAASAGTTLWAEDFSGYSANDVPDETFSSSDSHTGTTIYSGSVTYACTDGSSGTTKIYNENTAGGTAPELMVSKYSGTFAVTGIPKAGASAVTVYFTTNNQNMTVASSTTGYSGSYNQKASGVHDFDITCGSASTFDLTFTGPSGNSNIRLDDIQVKVKTAGASGTTTWTSSPDCTTPKELTSITIDTDPTRLNYVTGEFFDPTGAVVTAHYDDPSTETVTNTTSWSPSTALTAGTGQTATASYTEGGVTKTATVTYNVYTPTLAKKDETGTAISGELNEAPAISRSAATVTAAANGNQYVFKEWQISGGTFSGGVTTTSTNPATITSVSGPVTVTAVYYKPVTVTWHVPSGQYDHATNAHGWSLVHPANPNPATYNCDGKVFVGWTTSSSYSHASVAPTFVNNGTAANADMDLYAVFAVQTNAGTPPTWEKKALASVDAGTYLICNNSGYALASINESHHGSKTTTAFSSASWATSSFSEAAPLGALEVTLTAKSTGFTMSVPGSKYIVLTDNSVGHIYIAESDDAFWQKQTIAYTDYWRYEKQFSSKYSFLQARDEDFRNYSAGASGNPGTGVPITFLKKTSVGTPATYSDYATSCSCEGYSFHTGSGTDNEVKATNTRTCFIQDGTDNNMWKITNYTIPEDTKFFVGWQDEFQNGSSPYDYSVVAEWTAAPVYSSNKWQGQMFLVPNSGSSDIASFAVGQATGAKGTLRVYNNSGDKNKYVNFEPNGYGITYSGTGHAFGAAVSNMRETEVLTMPDVSSTTYTMGLLTGTANTYVTCAHSKAAENINAMGVTILQDGKKRIRLVPGSFDAANAVYAVWDGTNSAWGDGTTKLMKDVGEGVWEGVVASNCVKINLVRLSEGTTASNIDWGRRWNQTGDIAVNDLLKEYTITSMADAQNCAYSTTSIHPATGQKGKFRMWDNHINQNWDVMFIPYYHLTYDGNGGGDPVTGVPASPADVCCEGNDAARTVAISSTEPTRSGYRFMGWATSTARAAAGTVDYKYGTANDDVELTKDLTLYAVWKQTYNVTYNYDGGSGSCSDGSYIEGESVPVCASNPTKAGCDFAGWSYSPSVTVTTGTFPMPGSAVTITATWTDHTYVLSHTGSNFTNTENATTIKSGDTPLTLHYTCTGSYGFPNNVTITGGGKVSWTKDTHYTWTVAGDKKSATLVINSTTISADVDIAITMATTYTVTYVHNDKGTFSGGSTTETVFSNDNVITLPTVTSVSCGLYDTFEGWIASGSEYSESTSKPATVYAGGASYTVTADVTLRALYSKCEGDNSYVYAKVTSDPGDWSGTYLIVNETYSKAMDGSQDQAHLSTTSNNVAVTISSSQVASNETTDTYAFTIAPHSTASGKYSICSHSGYYIGSNTAGNNINITATEATYSNAISISAGVLTIGCGKYKDNDPSKAEYRLMFLGSGSGSPVFKYYPNTQGQVCLYKKQPLCTKYYATNPTCILPIGVHVTYDANALDATMNCSGNNWTYKVESEVNKYPKLAATHQFCNDATRTGYTLIGWNTRADGLGTTYNINTNYTNLPVSGDLGVDNYVTLDLYAMWAPAVSFNVGNATGGTGVPDVVEADGGFMLPTPTAEQLGTIPCEYTFYGWSETSVTPTTTKPTLYMPGTKYTGSYRTLYAVYRKGEAGSDPNLFSLSYTISATKYYVAAPSDITTAPSTWSYPYTTDKKFVASTNAEDAVAFGMKTNAEYTSYKQIYWLYDGNPEEKVYMQYSSGANVRFNSQEDTYNQKWTVTGTTELTFLHSGGRYLSGTTTEIGCPSDVGVSTFTKEEASTTVYTYATSPTCYTTATLQFVTNGGTLNNPTAYTSGYYEDLDIPTTVYLPTATFPGEWVFEGWLKGSPLSSQTEAPTGANFYPVTLNTTTYTADAVGEVYFYAVYSKTVNDKQFDPDHEGTYKLFAILSDGTTKYYMPVWGGTQTTLDEVTNCVSTGDYTITPGTGEHAGQYKITHGSYTLGVRDDANTQFKNDANAWWNIEPSTSGKGTYRITIVGSSNRCMSYGGTGFFGNYTVNDVNRPSQPGYRDMEIGECIYTEYTSTPENIPYITITGSPVKITSANGQRVYAPTKLHIEAHNFSTTRTIHFSATNGFATSPASVTCLANGSYSGDIDIYYQPTSDGDGSIVSSVLTASQVAGPAAEQVSQTFTAISGRNLPANFVIAVKSGEQWYALPDDCHSSGTPRAVPIEVDDDDAPTAATLVPHNTEWRLNQVVGAQSSGSRPKDKIYFYEPNVSNYALKANSAPNISTEAQVGNIGSANSAPYEWGLATTDLCAYTISNANVNKNISIDTKGTIGTHISNVVSETLYLLPITAYYEPAEFQVVEWKANSVVVMYLGNAAKASVQVGDNDEGSNQTLEDVKVDHGVYELAASGLTSATFAQLQIVFKNAGGTELQRNYVTIPAIINGNVATSTFESVKDLAESNDVVILKGGKLTSTGTGTPATSYSFANITIYGGGKLDVAAGTKLGVTGSLILRAGGIVDGAYDYVYPQLNLASTATLTNSSGYFYYEYITDYNRWYHLVLPFDARTTSIKYPTEYYGSAVAADNHGSWVIKRYDGATRATGNYNAWVDIESAGEPTPTTVNAGKGYIFWGAPKKVTANGVKDRQAWGIQRISMQKAAATAISEENGDKTITGLGSYSGVSGNSGKNNDQGWNLIGNPYMVNLTGLNSTSLQVGQLVHTDTDPWDGKWEWDNTDPDAGGLRYVTIPDDHFDNYNAQTMTWFTAENPMKTGRTFFVQIAGANTSVVFASANRASLMPAWERRAEAEQKVDIETGIVLSDDDEMRDEVNFWIKNDKTEAYEYNADYPKTPNNTNFNIYGVHEVGQLSWVAISPEIAEGSMAIGYQVPAAGDYTLSLSETYVSDKIEALYVTDHEVTPEFTTNLMEDTYSFGVKQAERNDTRFTARIVLKDEAQVPTDVGNVDGMESNHPLKFLYRDKLYILRNGVLYDATGKKVSEINK